jgi:phosphoribosylformylglycinamidine cyclo-ligase
MPPELTATLDRGTWTPAPVFDVVRQAGAVAQPDLEATLNCGVGMVALTAPDSVDAALSLLSEAGIPAWVAGEASAAGDGEGGRVSLVGEHAG